MNECLDKTKERHLDLPICYGRISNTRNCTYTMVYSQECKADGKMGRGIVIPFSGNPVTIEQIKQQASAMIEAEHNAEVNFERYNWSWGALGIAVNPAHISKESEKYNLIAELLKYWSSQFGKKFQPNDYRVGIETAIMSQSGNLLIDWKEELNDLDFVIGTAIKPEIPAYPNPEKITARMKVSEYEKYFRENINAGISTYQDGGIIKLLDVI
jgi:hypothetical protein